MKIPFALIFAHSRRTWVRSALTVLSVFIAVLILGVLRTIIVGLESTASGASEARLVVQSDLSLFGNLPRKIGAHIGTIDGVKAVTHWTWFGGVYVSDDQSHMWGRFGVDVPTLREVYGNEMDLDEEAWGRLGSERTACVIGEDLALTEKLEVGSKVPIVGNLWPGRIELEVVGIYKSKNPSFDPKTLFFPWDYMNEVSKANGGRTEQVSTFTILLEDPAMGPAVRAAVDSHFAGSDSRTKTQTERAFQSQFITMFGNVPFYFSAIGTVVLLVCLMVTANTMYLNASERVRELGILQTLGFSPSAVSLTMITESLLLCAAGGGLALLVLKFIVQGSKFLFIPLVVPATTLQEGILIIVGLGLLAGLYPALIARRLDIIESLRRTA